MPGWYLSPAMKLNVRFARVVPTLVIRPAKVAAMTPSKLDGMEKVMMGLTDIKMVRQVCIK